MTKPRFKLNPEWFALRPVIARLLILVFLWHTVAPFAASHSATPPIRKSPDGSTPVRPSPNNRVGRAEASIRRINGLLAPQAGGISLTPLGTSFNNSIGIDYHQPTNKIVLSVNYPSGQPRNFELIAADGTHAAFSNLAGLTVKLKMATARDDGGGLSRGSFHAGELFAGTNTPGVIARISADGASVQNPWVSLPGESGLINALHIDRTGVYGGDLIAVTAQGNVWRINASGTATLVVFLGLSADAVMTVPNDASRYGPWAGKILVGIKQQGSIYAINPQGAIVSYQLGINPQDLDLIPANENLFAVDSGAASLLGASASQFAAMTGDLLVTQNLPGALWRIHWTGTEFQTSQVAQANQLESVAFAPAGVFPLGATTGMAAVVRHAPSINGRVEGALRQLTGESIVLNSGAVITTDLLVPGTPQVVLNGTPNFGGTITGSGSAQPTGYQVILNSNATLGHLLTRTNPITLPTVTAPPNASGTRDVVINTAGQSPGDFATLRDLTLNGNVGMVNVPPGTYRNFTANAGSGFVFGVAGSTTPAVYNLRSLTLNGTTQLQIAGPVVLTLALGATLNGTVGAGSNSLWLTLKVASGGITLNGGSLLYGTVIAPSGTIIINGNSTLTGSVQCDRLTVNGNGLLRGAADATAPSITIDQPSEGALIDAAQTVVTGTVYDQTAVSVTVNGVAATINGNTYTATVPLVMGANPLTAVATDLFGNTASTSRNVTRATNQAPTANAGADQTLSLPASASLSGSASDDGLPTGSTLTTTWSKVSGPGSVTFASPNQAVTSASFSAAGTYTLRLTASDGPLASSDDVVINVTPANQAPVVNAGPDQTGSFNLLQNPGNEKPLVTGEIADWTEVTGNGWTQATAETNGFPASYQGSTYFYPGQVAQAELSQDVDVLAFASAIAAGTQQFVFKGYVRSFNETPADSSRIIIEYRDAANATVLAAFDSNAIQSTSQWTLISDTRTAPAGTRWIRVRLLGVRNTGVNCDSYFDHLTLEVPPLAAVKLNGTATDDGLPLGSMLATSWTKVSGPGTVTFTNLANPVTWATFDAPGTYVLRLNASDSQLSASDDVTVTVAAINQAPVVSAGADQTINLPVNSVSLNGTASDDGLPTGSTLTTTWSKVSGPGAVTFADASQLATSASFDAAGTYVLRLTATDSDLSASDDITISINQAPAVNAGADQSITLPSAATLTGTASDDGLPTGSSLSVTWSKVSGPGDVSFANATQLATTASFTAAGTYVLRLTATDGALTSNDDVTVTVIPANQAPIVNAGVDQTINLPASAALNGTASDDGLPAGSTLTVTWSKVSGPGSVTFANPNQAATTASFSAPGVYVLRLTATDSDLSSSDDITISVNQAPTVNAGADQTITLPASATLNGTASDDGLPAGSTLSVTWSKVSGPGNVTFSNPTALTTTASFAAAGAYVLRLTATDGVLTSSDELTVTVNPANQAPVVNAGADQTISLPASASLNGSVSDDGLPVGGALTSTWSKVSGPGTVTFGNPNQAATTASFNAPGTYVLRLTANDSALTSSDDVTITVTPPNQTPQVNAGPDQSILPPANTVTLNGSVTDDGLPVGSSVSILWTKVSGAGTVTFADATHAVTTATFAAPGIYVLRLVASDGQLSASDDVTITVDNPTLTLTPASAGPLVTGTSQTMTATLKSGSGAGLVGVTVQFTVTGANLTGGSAVTNSVGDATFTYTGANNGNDTVTASVSGTSLQSNTATISWVAPIQAVSTTTVLARFFASDGSGAFNTPSTADPVLTQHVPTINYNPPAGTVPGNTSGVGVDTRPFTNVTTDLNNNFTGTIIAQGNGVQVGVGPLASFNAVFTGSFVVAAAGNVTFNFFTDDGFILGIGGGATRVSGALTNPPPLGLSPFEGLPVLGAFNTNTAPVGNTITVHFPAPGVYPYEVDYSECCGGQLVLTMATVGSGNKSVPPTGSLVLSPPSLTPQIGGGQLTFTVTAADASGQLLSGVQATLFINGANAQQLIATTDATGRATFTYRGSRLGSDTLQAVGAVNGMQAFSNITTVQWNQGSNAPPVVNAGPDQTLVPPANTVTLSGTATDDGKPVGGGPLTYHWSQVSGPDAVSFGSPNQSASTVMFSGVTGTYVLRLSVSDSDLTASDDVRVKVITPCVAQLPGMVSWWQGEGDTTDRLGSNNATPNGSITYAQGKVGQAFNFNGTNGYLQLPTINLGTTFTVEFWMFPRAGFDGQNLIANSFPTSNLGALYLNTNYLAYWQSGILRVSTPVGSIALNQWSHVALTHDGLITRLYVNGTLLGSSQSNSSTYNNPARLGYAIDNHLSLFNGLLDEVALYNRALTAEEIAAIDLADSNGRCLLNQAPRVDAGPDQNIVFPGSATLNGTATDDGKPEGSPPLTYQWSKVSGPGTVSFSTANQPATTATFSAAGTYTLRLSVSDSQLTGSDNVIIKAVACTPAPAGLTHWWPANGNANDIQGVSHGTLINGATFAAGMAGQGFSFDGVDDFVQLPDNLFVFPTTGTSNVPFTFDLWFKTSTGGVILGQQIAAPFTTPTSGWVPAIYIGTNGKLYVEMFWHGTQIVSPTALNDGVFHHLGITHDGATERVYVDGVLTGSGANTEESFAANYKYQLGTGYTASGWPATNGGWYSFKGLLDDAHLYNRVLTAGEINALYLAGAAGICGSGNTNQPPLVNAGADQTITLPATASLSGTATDDGLPTGSALSVQWSVVSGPGAVTFGNAAQAATTASFTSAGVYVLRLTASDGQLSASDDVQVTVNTAAANQAPQVNAGPDQVAETGANLIINGSNEAALVNGEITGWTEVTGTNWTQATAGTNGFPAAKDGTTYFYAGQTATAELIQDVDVRAYPAGTQFDFAGWVRSGNENPADTSQIIIDYRNAANTATIARLTIEANTESSAWQAVTDLRAAPAGTGFIRIRLMATRNSGTTNDGYFDAISLRAVGVAAARLQGTAADDGLPVGSSLSVSWSKVSGPGTVTFAASNQASTTAAFTTAGVYVLRLTVSDGQLTSSDDVQVTVTAQNQGPVVQAGADQTISLAATASLTGSVTDDGLPLGNALAVQWSIVSGPGAVTFGNAAQAATTASFTTAGVYVLRLQATDGEYTVSDDVQVTVTPNATNQAPVVSAGADQSINLPTTTATLNGTASDDGLPTGSTLSVQWSQVSLSAVGVYVLRLTASDGALTSSDDVVVSVYEAISGPAPVVTITSPTDGAEVTAPTAIVGSVDKGNWRLEYSLNRDSEASSQAWTLLASGSTSMR